MPNGTQNFFIGNYELVNKRHNRHASPPMNLTDVITACGPDDFVIRVTDNDAVSRVYKIPVDKLPEVDQALKDYFSPNEEHYSVRVVTCKDDDELLKNICTSLGA